jgi:hypothetical protein
MFGGCNGHGCPLHSSKPVKNTANGHERPLAMCRAVATRLKLRMGMRSIQAVIQQVEPRHQPSKKRLARNKNLAISAPCEVLRYALSL